MIFYVDVYPLVLQSVGSNGEPLMRYSLGYPTEEIVSNMSALLQCLAGLVLVALAANSHAYTLVTYNVAEFSDSDPERIGQLVSSIFDLKPDLVFVQEAELQTLKALEALPDTRAHYVLFRDGVSGLLPSSGLVLLAKRSLKPRLGSFLPLPSKLDRGALTLDVTLCGVPHRLVDVHLESPDLLFWQSRDVRFKQVEALQATLQDRGALIVAGDFNVFSEYDADDVLPDEWTDVWSELNTEDPGATWDPKTNSMASLYRLLALSGYRLDRVLFKSDVLVPLSISRLGVGMTPNLSDHYGLIAELVCQRK